MSWSKLESNRVATKNEGVGPVGDRVLGGMVDHMCAESDTKTKVENAELSLAMNRVHTRIWPV